MSSSVLGDDFFGGREGWRGRGRGEATEGRTGRESGEGGGVDHSRRHRKEVGVGRIGRLDRKQIREDCTSSGSATSNIQVRAVTHLALCRPNTLPAYRSKSSSPSRSERRCPRRSLHSSFPPS